VIPAADVDLVRSVPTAPPFAIRARVVTPLPGGRTRDVADGIIEIDEAGRIGSVGETAEARPDGRPEVVDLRPWVVLPGMVDLHAHLPQVPNAGLGYALPLLDWLERLTFPTARSWSDPAVAERLAPSIFRAFAAAGTTTILGYGVVYEAAMDAAFRAAEAHGIRAILGKVMMDRLTYDPTIEPSRILDRTLAESRSLAERWRGAADGRLGYAVTPRFAVSCSAELLRESATLARELGCWWQTHVAEDAAEIAEVGRLFPEARDYVDVYDRAGGLGPHTILAHAVHLSDRELGRLVESRTRVAHCPISNLFLASGVMPLGRYLEAGLSVGLGSDVAGGPDLSIFSVMRVGFYAQNARRVAGLDTSTALTPLDWLRLGTLDGARALGLGETVGSLEVGKEADLIAVDPSYLAPIPGVSDEEPEDLASRLIFRAHPDMVRASWVRGRRLEGPGARA
jgi:guanine deaminase